MIDHSSSAREMILAKATLWLGPSKPTPAFRFFPGLHQPSDAWKVTDIGPVERAFISVHRLVKRKSDMPISRNFEWIMDSGAFSTILLHHGYPEPVEAYAAQIKRWSKNGRLLAAVSQDYMCEAHMLALTGLTIADHQRLTIERYDTLMSCDAGGINVMPVLQGYTPADYVDHIQQYGGRLKRSAWVGVGSVCKRNGSPDAIEDVLIAIKRKRPDLLLHGFGLKITSLGSSVVRNLLHTADSMAWSYAERMAGRNANDVRAAVRFGRRIAMMPTQDSFVREWAA